MTGEGRATGNGNGAPWTRLSDAESLELVKRFQRGDRSAFERLYAGWWKSVFSFIALALRNRARAEELANDVFVSAFRALDDFEPRSESAFRSWLFRIAKNKVINAREKESRMRLESLDVIEEDALVAPEPPLERGLEWLNDPDLLALVSVLPQPQRIAIALRFSIDLSAEQVAEVMGRSVDDVYQLQRRALRHLETQLGKLGRPEFRRRRSAVLKRIKPLPVLGSRRFALENSLRPLPLARAGFSASGRFRW